MTTDYAVLGKIFCLGCAALEAEERASRGQVREPDVSPAPPLRKPPVQPAAAGEEAPPSKAKPPKDSGRTGLDFAENEIRYHMLRIMEEDGVAATSTVTEEIAALRGLTAAEDVAALGDKVSPVVSRAKAAGLIKASGKKVGQNQPYALTAKGMEELAKLVTAFG